MSIKAIITAAVGTTALAAGALTATSPVLAATTAHKLPSCSAELKAYREVSRQAGLRIGSQFTAVIVGASNYEWASELRHAGDAELARTAAGITSDASDGAFVEALTASADADLSVIHGGSQVGICTR